MPILHQIDPIALRLGPLSIHWYGLMYLLAFGIGYWLGLRRVRAGRLGISEAAFSDLMFYGMMGVILGGRLGYMLVYGWQDWIHDPLALLRVWEGGMSFHGGLVGVLVGMWWWSRRHRIATWDTIDFVAPMFPPGLGFGRLGNYIGGELWGKATDVPWAVVFPSGLPAQYAGLSPERLQALHQAGELTAYARHPSQLYEAVLEGLVMFALLWWYSARPRRRYAVSGWFAVLYGSFRFAVEFVRVPDAHLGYLAFEWLTMGQLLSLPLVAVGLVLLALSTRQPRPVLP
jgi:phosphatidylglycerol:prolipoprotein diacylglycerol transferase